jgi:hypothetical protein
MVFAPEDMIGKSHFEKSDMFCPHVESKIASESPQVKIINACHVNTPFCFRVTQC